MALPESLRDLFCPLDRSMVKNLFVRELASALEQSIPLRFGLTYRPLRPNRLITPKKHTFELPHLILPTQSHRTH